MFTRIDRMQRSIEEWLGEMSMKRLATAGQRMKVRLWLASIRGRSTLLSGYRWLQLQSSQFVSSRKGG